MWMADGAFQNSCASLTLLFAFAWQHSNYNINSIITGLHCLKEHEAVAQKRDCKMVDKHVSWYFPYASHKTTSTALPLYCMLLGASRVSTDMHVCTGWYHEVSQDIMFLRHHLATLTLTFDIGLSPMNVKIWLFHPICSWQIWRNSLQVFLRLLFMKT